MRAMSSVMVLLQAALLWNGGLSAQEVPTKTAIKADAPATDRTTLIVVVGAAGTPQYGAIFRGWAERWESAGTKAGHETIVLGLANDPSEADRDRLRHVLEEASKPKSDGTTKDSEVWLVLIGHGTFDKREARFNLSGPDLTAKELAAWAKGISRPLAIINCTSASAPFVTALAGPNRVVISATKSGAEQNYARLGEYLSQAITDPQADLDKDDQTSLFEAFLMASRRATEFYETDGRLVTEHAMLDDDGDGVGVRADQFRGLLPINPKAHGMPLDGRRAHRWHLIRSANDARLSPAALKKRNELELAIEAHRDKKQTLPRDEYLKELERLAVELAELNESGAVPAATSPPAARSE